MNRQAVGERGEIEVSRYLRKHGYRVLTANYRCRLGEIDLIAENNRYLCFVEVKTRGERALYAPADAVDYKKRERLIATAKLYLSQNPCKKQPRFDVAEVYMRGDEVQKINWIQNAYTAEG